MYKRQGAGRPKGSVNANRADFIERVRQAAPEMVDVVLSIIRDEETDANTKLRAIQLVWDRAYGRPRVEVDEAPIPTTLPGELIEALKK